MTTIVSMDSAGRVAVPNPVRRRRCRRLHAGSKFLVTERPDGRLVLSPLDLDKLAKKLQEELQDMDIDAEVERVQRELEEIAKRWYPEVAARMKNRRQGRMPGACTMAQQEPGAASYLPDTNLHVAAIRGGRRRTDTLRLLLKLVESDPVDLVGHRLLVEEYRRYSLAFPTPTALAVLAGLMGKVRVVEPAERFVRACEPHLSSAHLADVFHAATCLETGAVLISNDRHFDGVARAGLVQRLTLTEAVRTLLPPEPNRKR